MGLSEREQRILNEIEEHLVRDPGPLRRASGSGQRRRLAGGVLMALAGLPVLLAGVILNQVLIGLLGYAAMLTGTYLAIQSWRGAARGSNEAAGLFGSLTERAQDRWDQRRSND